MIYNYLLQLRVGVRWKLDAYNTASMFTGAIEWIVVPFPELGKIKTNMFVLGENLEFFYVCVQYELLINIQMEIKFKDRSGLDYGWDQIFHLCT